MNNNVTFEVGERVEAKYRGRGRRWYKGTIVNILQNGGLYLYDIDYDDGDRDRNLRIDSIRSIPKLEEPKLDVKDGAKSSPAKYINKKEHTNHVDEHQSEERVPPPRPKEIEEAFEVPQAFKMGQLVECKYKGRGRWYNGRVVDCFPDDTYNIQYNDGDKDYKLAAEHIRTLDEQPADLPYQSRDDEHTAPTVDSTRANVSSKLDTNRNKDTLRAESMHAKSVSTVSCLDNDITSTADGDVSFVVPISNVDEREIDAERPRAILEDTLKDDEEGVSSKESRHAVEEAPLTSDSERTQDVMREHSTNTGCSMGKGNRLYRGVVTNVKVVHLYEVKYQDGTRDVNLPFSALSVNEKMTASDIQVGSEVDVISWQDRFHVFD